jgi:hypothetical protein
MAVSFPARAHLVTVFGFTLNNAATSDGVSNDSGAPNWSCSITSSPSRDTGELRLDVRFQP